jgi:hypothetical protein
MVESKPAVAAWNTMLASCPWPLAHVWFHLPLGLRALPGTTGACSACAQGSPDVLDWNSHEWISPRKDSSHWIHNSASETCSRTILRFILHNSSEGPQQSTPDTHSSDLTTNTGLCFSSATLPLFLHLCFLGWPPTQTTCPQVLISGTLPVPLKRVSVLIPKPPLGGWLVIYSSILMVLKFI